MRQVVAPAGLERETTWVGLATVAILAAAVAIVNVRAAPPERAVLAAHEVDARSGLTPAEQGLYADLLVAAEDIAAHPAPPDVATLEAEGLPPFVRDASWRGRGGHAWMAWRGDHGEAFYLGQPADPTVAGSLLLHLGKAEPQVWLWPEASMSPPAHADGQALAAAGWKRVVSSFSAGYPMRRRTVLGLLAAALVVRPTVAAGRRLRIGVTLHPYHSFVANIVGPLADVEPIIPAGFNPHAYEPRPEDIRRIGALDVVVLNGIGHDDFAGRMIAASERPDLPLIEANAEVPLLAAVGAAARGGGSAGAAGVVNPHTFLSITGAVQQVYTIARELGRMDPDNAAAYTANARAYARRLRQMRAAALAKLADAGPAHLRVATIHGAYDYLLREFGLEVAAVVEPSHGIEPSPAQLARTIDELRSLDVQVVFSELNFPSAYVDTIRRETGIRLYPFSHISYGDYAPDLYEREMARNLDTLVRAILENGR